MNRMPEVYDNAAVVKKELNAAEEAVIYAFPRAAAWLVDQDYEPELTAGEAVKISKWESELIIVPVNWERDPETWQWAWREVGKPYRREIEAGGQI
ncbi:MAG: hypothetical protein P8184_09375 [Calditrichia bacterium]